MDDARTINEIAAEIATKIQRLNKVTDDASDWFRDAERLLAGSGVNATVEMAPGVALGYCRIGGVYRIGVMACGEAFAWDQAPRPLRLAGAVLLHALFVEVLRQVTLIDGVVDRFLDEYGTKANPE